MASASARSSSSATRSSACGVGAFRVRDLWGKSVKFVRAVFASVGHETNETMATVDSLRLLRLSGLGSASQRRWDSLKYCKDYHLKAKATICPKKQRPPRTLQ